MCEGQPSTIIFLQKNTNILAVKISERIKNNSWQTNLR